ncbi:MAG: hypothetical protein RI953_175 [Pseudomonadota bacterium]|jgi:hypothetical protein
MQFLDPEEIDGNICPPARFETHCILEAMGVAFMRIKLTGQLGGSGSGPRVPVLSSRRLALLAAVGILCAPNAYAVQHRDVSGESEWTSAALQGSAGIGALSESWVDQAQTDPSLLARRRATFEMEFANLSATVSRDAVNTVVDTVQSLTSQTNESSGSSAAQATVTALNKVRAVFGKSMTLQTQINLLSPRIGRVGIAPYASALLDASIDNAAWPKLDSWGGGYGGLLLSYSQIIQKDFDLGIALRPGVGGFRGYQVDLSLLGDFLGTGATSNSTGNPMADLLEFPTAVYCPLDLAAGWWVDKSTRVHLVSKNTFDAAPLNVISGTPGRLQNRLNLGVVRQIGIPGSSLQALSVASEVQDIAGIKAGWNELLLRLQWAARYEARLPFRQQTSFGLNVGMHSGYPVLSAHLDFIVFKMEFALSARENGAYSGQRPNRLMSARVFSQVQF